MISATEQKAVVGICDTQPLTVAGLRGALEQFKGFQLAEPSHSLEDAYRLLAMRRPDVMIVDKALGVTAVLEWLSNVQTLSNTPVVVWAATMTEAEALRFLKVGARGIIRKTADVETVLTCIQSVASGTPWMEDTLFRETPRLDRNGRHDLTPREQQVLELVEQGLRNKEIAQELGIRPGTVKIHLKHIFEKTGVRGRYGLALSGLKEKGMVSCQVA
jgi:two-component system nitrate/nitrite response regulator NarL